MMAYMGTFYGNSQPKICSRITGSSGLEPLHHSYTVFHLFGFQGNKLKTHLRGENEALEIIHIFLQTFVQSRLINKGLELGWLSLSKVGKILQ